jgi:hypothetical protein
VTQEDGHGKCRSCRADIVWLMTVGGKRMPVNAETVRAGDTIYEHGRHVSHFSTCPEQEQWRRKR